ncbi:hypothetical protein L2E82_24566 [Cichorium intybus]|uniref:Uncharacterized protein n=1 Tax=Cichorium intybus TaxID=13427 RepID=A0ACB9E241_CICIN|nr:hypothetical protein L2E82_24566 [Cichorium intybus]
MESCPDPGTVPSFESIFAIGSDLHSDPLGYRFFCASLLCVPFDVFLAAMAVLQLRSPFQFQNTSKTHTHVVCTRASSSVSSNLPITSPKSSDFGRLISKFKYAFLSFALSGALALAVTLSDIYSSSFYLLNCYLNLKLVGIKIYYVNSLMLCVFVYMAWILRAEIQVRHHRGMQQAFNKMIFVPYALEDY